MITVTFTLQDTATRLGKEGADKKKKRSKREITL
jgi:hypothetical protein